MNVAEAPKFRGIASIDLEYSKKEWGLVRKVEQPALEGEEEAFGWRLSQGEEVCRLGRWHSQLL